MERKEVLVRLDEPILDRITARAAEKRMSRNAWIEKALTYVLTVQGATITTTTTTTERIEV